MDVSKDEDPLLFTVTDHSLRNNIKYQIESQLIEKEVLGFLYEIETAKLSVGQRKTREELSTAATGRNDADKKVADLGSQLKTSLDEITALKKQLAENIVKAAADKAAADQNISVLYE